MVTLQDATSHIVTPIIDLQRGFLPITEGCPRRSGCWRLFANLKEDFERSLVSVVNSLAGVRTYEVDPMFLYAVQIHKFYVKLFGNTVAFGSHSLSELNTVEEVRTGPRFAAARFVPAFVRLSMVRANQYSAGAKKRTGATVDEKPVVDEDEIFMGPDHKKRKLSEYQEGDNIFHDCEDEKAGMGFDGVPSAFLRKGDRGGPDNQYLTCFACGTSKPVMRCHAPKEYKCKDISRSDDYLRIDALDFIRFRGKFNVFDAQCGAGKTELVSLYCRTHTPNNLG